MATVGSSERPGCTPCPVAIRAPAQSGIGLVLSPPEYEEKFSACVEGQSDCRPPPTHPASGTQRHICFGERLHRRSDPEKSSTQPGRKDCDNRRGQCDYQRMVTPWSAVLDYNSGEASTLVQVQFQQKAPLHRPGRSACSLGKVRIKSTETEVSCGVSVV